MKLALNGALTIGTLDGANIEIRDEVGEDNIFIFGNTADELDALRRSGYRPMDFYNANHELKTVLDMVGSGFFSPAEPTLFQPIISMLLEQGDHFMVLADYADYIRCQEKVAALYQDPDEWTRHAIINVARMGKFSSDRTIQEYADEIWNIKPINIDLPDTDTLK